MAWLSRNGSGAGRFLEPRQWGDFELSLPEKVEMIEHQTRWAQDFDQESQAELMVDIWEACQLPAQRWDLTIQRQRVRYGTSRLEEILVERFHEFPTRDMLRQSMTQGGYGGGRVTISSFKGRKVSHQVVLDGEPEDPLAVAHPTPAERDKGERHPFKNLPLDAALKYLSQNPAELRDVGLRLLAKEWGIKVRLPDPDAPVPYVDLPPEIQDYLDENPEEKAAYVRRELGLDPPVFKPTIEERVVDGIVDELIEDLCQTFRRGKTGGAAGEVFARLIGNNTLERLIEQLAAVRKSDTFSDQTPG